MLPETKKATSRRLLTGAPYVILIALLIRMGEDLDTWFHLGIGRWIWQQHRLPVLDPFSWTAVGRPYIDSHWLFQVILYPPFQWGGMPAIVLLQALVFVWAFWLLSRSLPEPRPIGFWEICLGLAVVNTSDRFLLRPEMLTFLFMAVFWQRLFRPGVRLTLRDVALLFFCQVIWVNVHGLFLCGVAFCGCYLAGAVAGRYLPLPKGWREREDLHTPARLLALLGGAILIACLVSPYGADALRYAWLLYQETRHATGKFMPTVAELANPYRVYQLQPGLLAYYLLSALTFGSILLNRRTLRLSALMLVAAFFAIAQFTVRNTAYFAFIAAPFCAVNFIQWAQGSSLMASLRKHWAGFEPARWRGVWIASGVCGLSLGVWAIASDRFYIATQQTSRFGMGQSPFLHLDEALAFAHRTGLRGPLMNDILFGGPLLYGAPEKKLFVDGRLEVYGEDFLTEYKRAMDFPDKQWDAYARRYELEVLWLSALSPYSRYLIDYLKGRPDWPLVYADDSALIFVRRDGVNRERRAVLPPYVLPRPVPGEIQSPSRWKRFWRHPYPLHALSMGRLALLLGQRELAKEWNETALRFWPGCGDALFNLGTVFFQEKDYAQAEIYYRAVLERRPFDANALAALGDIAFQGQRLAESRGWLGKAVLLNPGLASAWSSLGLIDLIENKNAPAQAHFKRALALGSDDAVLHNNLGVANYRLGQSQAALSQFKLALERDPQNASARQALKLLAAP